MNLQMAGKAVLEIEMTNILKNTFLKVKRVNCTNYSWESEMKDRERCSVTRIPGIKDWDG